MHPISERLTQKMNADHQALKQAQNTMTAQIQEHAKHQLKQHEQQCSKLLTDARKCIANAIAAHQSAVDQMHRQAIQRMRWMLLWPLLAVLTLSILILTTTTAWTWWRLNSLHQEEQLLKAQITRLTENFCQSPAGRATCKTRE